MEKGWKSDWDRLFAKCATDPRYRERLDAALGKAGTKAAADLLRSIGIKGRGKSDLVAQVRALKKARGPMHDVTKALRPAGPRIGAG